MEEEDLGVPEAVGGMAAKLDVHIGRRLCGRWV